MENLTEKERMLWRQAKKRVKFRRHLGTYLIINAFFWALWYFTDRKDDGDHGIPWPVFPMFGWGIGLAFHFFDAYFMTSQYSSVEKEFEKLKKKDLQ